MQKEQGSASVSDSTQKRPTSLMVVKDHKENDANLNTCNSKRSSKEQDQTVSQLVQSVQQSGA
jgi:hypothetical protein